MIPVARGSLVHRLKFQTEMGVATGAMPEVEESLSS